MSLTPYTAARLNSCLGGRAKASLRPAACASRSQANTTARPEESTALTRPRSKTVSPVAAARALRPSCSTAVAPSSVRAPPISMGMPLMKLLLGAAVVLALQNLDQAVDAAVADFAGEAVAVVGHQTDARHLDVVDLPGAGILLQRIVQLDRLGAVLLLDQGAHLDFGFARLERERLVFDGLVAILGQRLGIGADLQGLELLAEGLL